MLCSFLRFIRKIFGKNTKNNLKYYKIYFKSVYKYFFKYTKYFNILVAIPDPALKAIIEY